MCRMASFVLTRDNVYWSQLTDSHEEIIKEYGLKEEGLGKKISILRVEVAPENGDYMLPIDKWVFGYDQDLLPEWADREKDEARTREALQLWYSECCVGLGVKRESVNDGDRIKMVCGGTISAIMGGTISAICGGTISAIRGGTISEIRGGTISDILGGTISAIWGGTISAIRGGTILEIWGGTILEIWGGTISAIGGGTISVIRGGTISEIGGGTISDMKGNATANFRSGTKPKVSEQAVLVDRSGDTVRIITANKRKATK